MKAVQLTPDGPEVVEVLEIWHDGRHYVRLPNGAEIPFPDDKPHDPNEYIFREGDGSWSWTTSDAS